MSFLSKFFSLFNGGWEKCVPPKWINFNRLMNKGEVSYISGKYYKYKFVYIQDEKSRWSAYNYNVYRKKINKAHWLNSKHHFKYCYFCKSKQEFEYNKSDGMNYCTNCNQTYDNNEW